MTTTVRAPLAAGRSFDADDFADLTPAEIVDSNFGADGRFEVTFDADLDAATIRAIRCRIVSETPAEEALMMTLAALAAEQPTTVADRLLRLERAVLALVRLELRDS